MDQAALEEDKLLFVGHVRRNLAKELGRKRQNRVQNFFACALVRRVKHLRWNAPCRKQFPKVTRQNALGHA
jgi:hypothetical protein